jgi:hypothetical protein
MVERALTALEVAVLGLWAGALAGFAFVYAPLAIRIVPDMTVFANLVGATIRGLGTFGTACGALAAGASLLRARDSSARPVAAARIALVAIALAASAYEAKAIVPGMEATAARIPGPIDSVPKDDPRRAAYDAQHDVSTRVYGSAFLCVVAAAVLAAFGRKRAR